MNCGRETICTVEHPVCSVCRSSRIVDSKEVPVEISATMLRTEVKKSLKEMQVKEIQPLINGYFHIQDLMENIDKALKNYAETIKTQDQRIQHLERKVRTTMV